MSKIGKPVSFVLCCCALMGMLQSADLTFQEVSGDESGLKKIMQDWKDAEFKLQNGDFGSHGWWPWGLTAFDIDNDGDIDLVPVHHGKPGGKILKSDFVQTGTLTFKDVTADMDVEERSLPHGDDKPTAWDFNGDGYLDLAGWTDEGKAKSYLNIGGKTLKVLENHSFSPVAHMKDADVVDLNGDGYLDFAGHFRTTDLYKIWDPIKNTFIEFENTHKKEQPNVPQEFLDYFAELKKMTRVTKKHPHGYLINRFLSVTYLTDYDLNLDGHKDLIAQSKTAYGVNLPAAYFLSDGSGTYVDKTEALGLPKEGAPQLIKDLTGDGLPDIFVVRKDGAGFYMATKEGKFVKPANEDLNAKLKEGGSYLQKIMPVDLDNDGDLDLVISLPREGREEIYENKGQGSFKLILKFSGWDANPIAICDLNNDGLMDIAVGGSGTLAGRSSKKNVDITLFLNTTKTANKYCNVYPRMPAPNPYAVGARLEVFAAGTLGKPTAVAVLDECANIDASPIHIGLGLAETFDCIITFPGKVVHEHRNVTASKRLILDIDGSISVGGL